MLSYEYKLRNLSDQPHPCMQIQDIGNSKAAKLLYIESQPNTNKH
jgi:hypothetical protein